MALRAVLHRMGVRHLSRVTGGEHSSIQWELDLNNDLWDEEEELLSLAPSPPPPVILPSEAKPVPEVSRVSSHREMTEYWEEDGPELAVPHLFARPVVTPIRVEVSFTASVEQIPPDASQEHLTETIKRLAPSAELVRLDLFLTKKNTVRNALISLASQQQLDEFLTPSRLAFGTHINGQRCPTYNAADRVLQVIVRGLPRRLPLADDVERMLREALPDMVTVKDIRIPRRPAARDEHRGIAVLTLASHDEARAALASIIKGPLGASHRFLTAELGVENATDAKSPMSSYELMLHQVRQRVYATEQENARLRAALEKAGISESHT